MLKKLLFGLTLASFVGAASAQGLLNKRTSRFNTVKSELKANAKTLDRKVSFDGLHAAAATAAVKNVPTGMRRAASSSTWFQYSFTSNGRVGILDNTSLAEVFEEYGAVGTDSYNMHVVIPKRFANAVIDSVCNVFYETKHMTNCRIWIHNIELNSENQYSIPLSAEYADYSMTVDTSDIKGLEGNFLQMSDFKLDKPFTVGENGCLVGFQFTAPADSACVVFGGTSVNGGWYHMLNFPSEDDPTTTEPGWVNMYGAGNLPIGAHLDVSACPSNDVTVNHVLESTFKAGTENEIPVSVTNNAYKAVESVSYILTIDGTAEAEKTLTLDENYQIEGGSNGYLYVPATIAEGEHFVSVEVTKVNGVANDATATSGTGYVLGVNNPAERVSVVEEATSTACGYCPRGTVGLRKVKEALGDKVITLSVHGDYSSKYSDPMACDDYALYLSNFVSSFPAATVDRVASVDPYVGLGIGSDWYEIDAKGNLTKYKFALDKSVTTIAEAYPSEASIALSATLNDKTITANTTTTFNVDRETAPYSLVFVLTENCMTGTDNGKTLWTQYNYYSQAYIDAYYNYYGQDVSTYFIDSDMDEYKNGSYQYTETYNNVVVGAWGGTYQGYEACPIFGIAAFENQDIVAGEAKAYNTTFDISKNALIQGYDHLYLAVLLINDNNYQIVNAAQVKLADPTSINGAVKDSKATEVARYSIDGRKLNAPVKGLNIVKMADGSSKTVLVK